MLSATRGFIAFSQRYFATWASTALNGSSRSNRSAPLYNARAMDKRCFCPPDKLSPLDPTSVWSPAGSADRSSISAEALRAAA
mmetsp:Transcript_56658/g.113488  ORF Transcript_56658/g.113488 Transcript_56658/m.113488 type:complete len:83 (-) Transcript_56658:51-299(-)